MKLDQTPLVPTDPAIDSAEGGEDVGLVDAGAFAAFLSSLKEAGEVALPADSLLLPSELLDPELAALEKAAAAGEGAAVPIEALTIPAEVLDIAIVSGVVPLSTEANLAPSIDIVSELEPAALAGAKSPTPEARPLPVLTKSGEVAIDVVSDEPALLEALPTDTHDEAPPEALEFDGALDPSMLPADLPTAAELSLAARQEPSANAATNGKANESVPATGATSPKHAEPAMTKSLSDNEAAAPAFDSAQNAPEGASATTGREGAGDAKASPKEAVSESDGDSALAERAMEIARASRGLPEPVPLSVATDVKPNAKLATLERSLAEAPAVLPEAHHETLGRAKLRFGEAEKTVVRTEQPATATPEDVSASDLAARSREVRRDVLREKLGAGKPAQSAVPEARFAAPRVAMSVESATKHAESKAVDAEVRQVASGEAVSSELRLGEERNREERHEELAGSPEVAQADALIERPVLEVGDAMPTAFDSRDRMTAAASPLGKGLGLQAENGVQGFFGLHSTESANEAAPVYVQQRLIRTAEAEIDHPELGRIDLSMRAEAGGVSVKASTRSEIAAAVLSANEGGLRRTSNDRGVAIKNFKVALRNDLSSSEEKSRAAGASRGLLNTEA